MRFLTSLNLASSREPFETEDKALLLEAWKQSIDVQKHFNEIGWRIRSLLLSMLTFVVGATFLVSRTFSFINPEHYQETQGVIAIPIAGLILWVAFWFVDAFWYQKFLVGAVKEASRLERELAANGIDVRLSQTISANSPSHFFRFKIRSSRKLHVFYLLAGLPLIISVFYLALN